MANKFETSIIDVEKDIEVAAADVVKIFGAIATKSPAGLAALTVLAGAVEKALADAAADTNVSTLLLTLPTTIADFKTVWADGVVLLADLGVK